MNKSAPTIDTQDTPDNQAVDTMAELAAITPLASANDDVFDAPQLRAPRRKMNVANDGTQPRTAPDVDTNVTLETQEEPRRVRMRGLVDDVLTSASFNPEAAPSAQGRDMLDDDYAEHVQVDTDYMSTIAKTDDMPDLRPTAGMRFLRLGASVATSAWLAGAVLFALAQSGNVTLPEWAALLAGASMPILLLWVWVSHATRTSEIKLYATTLRRELQSIIFPSEARNDQVHSDIERLTHQAAQLAGASQSVLKAIHAARQDLRGEIREFATLAKKTEVHIMGLSDALAGRASDLQSVMSEIEQRIMMIDERSRLGVTAWDDAAALILDRASEIEIAMGRGADKILDAAARAHDSARDIDQRVEQSCEGLLKSVDTVSQRLGNLSESFEGHTGKLSNVSEDLTRETARLGMVIEEQVQNLQDMTVRTVEAMASSAMTVEQQRGALDSSAQEMLARARDVASAVSGSVSMIEQATETVERKAEEIEQRLQRQSTLFDGTLSSMAKQTDRMEDMGRQVTHRLTEAVDSALSSAGGVESAIRRSVESLNKATSEAQERAETLTKSTRAHIERLGVAGQAQVIEIRDLMALLQQARNQVEASTASTHEQVLQLTDAVDTQAERIANAGRVLTETIVQTNRALEDPLKAIAIAVSEVDGRHSQIETTLMRRVADLQEASDKAIEAADNIRSILRNQVQDIGQVSAQLSGNARTINDQMIVTRDDLLRTVSGSMDRLKDVHEQLERTGKQVKIVSAAASEDVTALEVVVERSAEVVSQAAKRAKASLSEVEQDLEIRARQLVLRSDDAKSGLQSVTRQLEDSAQTVTPLFDGFMAQSEEMRGNLERLRTGFEHVAASNLEKLGKIGILFDERLIKLQDGSLHASSLLKSTSEDLRVRVDDIEGAARSASDKMRQITSTLERQSSDIHILTDQTILKIEGVRDVIADQLHELTEAVGQALTQMQETGLEFVKRADDVGQAAEDVTRRFEAAGARARDEAERLNNSADRSISLAAEAVKSIQVETEGLMKKTQDSLGDLRAISESFAIRSKEISIQMGTSLDTSKSYGAELRAQAIQIAEAGSKSADEIARVTAMLQSRMQEVARAASDVIKKLEVGHSALGTQTQMMVSASAEAVASADEAAQNFARQSSLLFKAAKEAVDNAEKIRATEIRAQRETFLSSARFVMESLYSLSVDFVRMIEGDVPEKLWKSYQKGDVALFTQRLVENLDRIPADKVRTKYADDSEFRNYVQRYLRQFEDVFDQAMDTDRGDLLGGAFLASDIGKLYRYLCAAAGREPRGMTERTRAAA